MNLITQYMQQDHRDCDEPFSLAEGCASEGNWADAISHWDTYREKIEHHLRMEEEVLFPSFEAETGNTDGPTVVMRMEHEQMRGVMAALGDCLENQDQEQFLGMAEMLMLLIQQHNMKEEQMLYPMADQALSDTASLLAEMQALGDA
jgi:hemerythrin-like domain-containing protein